MIYIVEDDASIRELEQYALQTNQYTVRGFEDGASFWAAVRETVPDLVILDVMLPDEDGYQILGRLRETAATRTVPVIMVTAKTSEIDVVKGLDHGADDYLCKPFGIMEFISRVKAVLRRASAAPASTTTLRFGDITLDDVARTVTVDGEPVELTFKTADYAAAREIINDLYHCRYRCPIQDVSIYADEDGTDITAAPGAVTQLTAVFLERNDGTVKADQTDGNS